ncbi:MAG: hypothetical protein EBX47_11820 [Synechococcaceae bacterium WB8_1B_057]|nr:hypothetical protein [Synechococcaceae bacterium WB8_1B_057]
MLVGEVVHLLPHLTEMEQGGLGAKKELVLPYQEEVVIMEVVVTELTSIVQTDLVAEEPMGLLELFGEEPRDISLIQTQEIFKNDRIYA